MLTKNQLYSRYDALCDIRSDLRSEEEDDDMMELTISMLDRAICYFEKRLKNKGTQEYIPGKSVLMKVKLDDGALLPDTDVGVCLKSPVDVSIPARGRGRIDTGVHVSIPKGTVGIIKTTSSLNAIGLQCEGVIDEGYTGEVSIILENHNYNRIIVDRGEMIAQLVVLPVIRPKIEFVDELKETEKRQRLREQWEMKPVEEQR